MSASVEDNFEEALDSIEEGLPEESHELRIGNVMEYAKYLQLREGFFVLNKSKLEQIADQKMRALDSLEDEKIVAALDTASVEYVDWLADIIGTKEGGRKQRQGKWADRTGNLAAGWRSQVDDLEVRDHEDVAPDVDEVLEDQTLEFPAR